MVCTSTISTIRPRTMHPVSNISICRIVIPLTRNGDPTFCPVIHQEDAVIPHGSVLRAFNTRARKEREGEQKKHRRHPIIGCEDLIVAFYARVFVSHCRHFPAPYSTKALHTRPRGKCAVPDPLLLEGATILPQPPPSREGKRIPARGRSRRRARPPPSYGSRRSCRRCRT